MTVAELIEALRSMPQDAPVEAYRDGCSRPVYAVQIDNNYGHGPELVMVMGDNPEFVYGRMTP